MTAKSRNANPLLTPCDENIRVLMVLPLRELIGFDPFIYSLWAIKTTFSLFFSPMLLFSQNFGERPLLWAAIGVRGELFYGHKRLYDFLSKKGYADAENLFYCI